MSITVCCNNCGESEDVEGAPQDVDLSQACPYCYAHELTLVTGDGEDFDPDS